MFRVKALKEKLRCYELELNNHKVFLNAYRKAMQSMQEDGNLTDEQCRELAFRVNYYTCT